MTGEMASVEIRGASYSSEVSAAFQNAGINGDDLLESHKNAPVDDCGWITSSFTPPELGGRTVWAITHIREKTTLFVFEGK